MSTQRPAHDIYGSFIHKKLITKHPTEMAVEESTRMIPNHALQLAVTAINFTPRWPRRKQMLPTHIGPVGQGYLVIHVPSLEGADA